jgi:hypothetical protein
VNVDALLSNPPAFVLLAGMVGLGAYLRQLGEARLKQIEELETGQVKDFPAGSLHTKEKLAHLQKSRLNLNDRVAPAVIFLLLALVARLGLLAVARLKYQIEPASLTRAFQWFDAIFMACLFVLFLALALMHQIGRRREERIRLMQAGWKGTNKSEDSKT